MQGSGSKRFCKVQCNNSDDIFVFCCLVFVMSTKSFCRNHLC